MAYEGRSPDGDWFQLVGRATEPTFPGTYSAADKVGTLYYNNGTGTIDAALWIFDAGTSAFSKITPNLNASIIDTGNLGAQFGGVPTGTILPFAKDVSTAGLPTGYLLCDGSSISQSTYATLFTAMGGSTGGGKAFGSTGTNFNLPDLRGLFLRGRYGTSTTGYDPDSGTRTAPATGAQTGNNVGSYQADAFQSHTHTVAVDAFRNIGSTFNTPNSTGPQIAESTPSYTTSTPSGTTSTETRPKNVYVDYIIRYL
jgi:microcystin-dependent protein